jgi:hypothetical protein
MHNIQFNKYSRLFASNIAMLAADSHRRSRCRNSRSTNSSAAPKSTDSHANWQRNNDPTWLQQPRTPCRVFVSFSVLFCSNETNEKISIQNKGERKTSPARFSSPLHLITHQQLPHAD